MTNRGRLSLIALGACALLLAIATAWIARVDVRSDVEGFASRATGLSVAVAGQASLGLLPTLHVTLKDVTASNGGSRVAAIGEANIGLALWPLLRGHVRVNRVLLKDLTLDIERTPSGRFNFTVERPDEGGAPALSLPRLVLVNATVRYVNQQADGEIRASGCAVESDDVQLSAGPGSLMTRLSLTGEGRCESLRSERFLGTDVRWSMMGADGRFELSPVTLLAMSGEGTGRIEAVFSQAVPTYRLRYAVNRLKLDDLFRSLATGKQSTGFLDLTLDLTLRGSNAAELTRTMQGEVSLRGENLAVPIGDLDEKLKRYESSQNFNLVDLGAFFVAGPLGTAVTKGYDFAGVFRETEGNTVIRRLLSQWRVAEGVAHATDVAFVTQQNRLALKGNLDFVRGTFEDVTVAVLDEQGCATIEQKIRGPFKAPEIVKPNVIASLAGPFSNAIRGAGRIVGVKCDVFYAGSIPPG